MLHLNRMRVEEENVWWVPRDVLCNAPNQSYPLWDWDYSRATRILFEGGERRER